MTILLIMLILTGLAAISAGQMIYPNYKFVSKFLHIKGALDIITGIILLIN